ncbi:hypothetical protein RhiJN_19334 [Ceratobasidium sp. AG-Ba]|nr:hypothetical protein RhiJN_19334 [Ceratobasidium sp. AG-Ba]
MPVESSLLGTQHIGTTSLIANRPTAAADSNSHISARESLAPSPQPTVLELADQVNALRAQLRDSRVAESKQRSQIKNQAQSIRDLTSDLHSTSYSRDELEINFNNERKAHRATEKKFEVAAANHSKAIDRLGRQSVEFKALRNEKDYLENGLLRAKDQLDTLRNLLDKTKKQLEDTGCTLVAFKHREYDLIEELKLIKVELESRDRKIKFLEETLDRQRKNNALIKADYREVDFARVPNVPIMANPSFSSNSKTSAPTNRTPLADFETNKEPKSRKRTRSLCDNEGVQDLAPKSSKRTSLNDAHHMNAQKYDHCTAPVGRPMPPRRNSTYLRTPSSSSSSENV